MTNSTPAIRREFTDKDRDVEVISTPRSGFKNNPGMGRSGHKTEIVKHDCPAPHCSFDRMIRRHDANPVGPDGVEYYCLSPNCAYYARDALSYDCHGSYPQRNVSTPVVTSADDEKDEPLGEDPDGTTDVAHPSGERVNGMDSGDVS